MQNSGILNRVGRFSILLACGLMFSTCRKGEVIPIEGVTTLRLIFSQPGGNQITFEFKDIDGIGGNDPVIDDIELPPLSVFNCRVEVLNESKVPVEDWTSTISQRSGIHLFAYKVTNDVMRFSNLNTDESGKPFGLTSLAAIKNGIGTLTIIMKHDVDKNSSNPIATGVTDIEATFPVKI